MKRLYIVFLLAAFSAPLKAEEKSFMQKITDLFKKEDPAKKTEEKDAKEIKEAQNKDKDKDKDKNEKDKPVDPLVAKWDPTTFHDKTPNLIRNKLSFGFGVGLGAGKDSQETTHFDLIGYNIYGLYRLMDDLLPFKLPFLNHMKPVVGFFYKTYSGIEVPKEQYTEDAYNIGVQNFLPSLGLEFGAFGLEALAMASFGMQKISKASQQGKRPNVSSLGGAMEFQGMIRYPLPALEGVYGVAGASLQTGAKARFGIECGIMGMF